MVQFVNENDWPCWGEGGSELNIYIPYETVWEYV